jgi:hypothetical protein
MKKVLIRDKVYTVISENPDAKFGEPLYELHRDDVPYEVCHWAVPIRGGEGDIIDYLETIALFDVNTHIADDDLLIDKYISVHNADYGEEGWRILNPVLEVEEEYPF